VSESRRALFTRMLTQLQAACRCVLHLPVFNSCAHRQEVLPAHAQAPHTRDQWSALCLGYRASS